MIYMIYKDIYVKLVSSYMLETNLEPIKNMASYANCVTIAIFNIKEYISK